MLGIYSRLFASIMILLMLFSVPVTLERCEQRKQRKEIIRITNKENAKKSPPVSINRDEAIFDEDDGWGLW